MFINWRVVVLGNFQTHFLIGSLIVNSCSSHFKDRIQMFIESICCNNVSGSLIHSQGFFETCVTFFFYYLFCLQYSFVWLTALVQQEFKMSALPSRLTVKAKTVTGKLLFTLILHVLLTLANCAWKFLYYKTLD
jgi:hypothetical protein